jgi:hypothetical protein
VALRIVRAEGEDAVVRPLRLWYGGRHAEALAALVAPDADASLDELGQLVELALAHDLKHASRLGEALVSWNDEAAAYRLLRSSCERLLDDLKPLGPDVWMSSAIALIELTQPWLSRQPHEPVLMNYVGVAVYGLHEPALAVDHVEGPGHEPFELAGRDPAAARMHEHLDQVAAAQLVLGESGQLAERRVHVLDAADEAVPR